MIRAMRGRNSTKIAALLAERWPDAHCELDHENAYQLVVATILSAQSTDKMINTITPALFKKYPNARALARADQGQLEKMIHSSGFFRAKAKNLIGMARAVVEKHGGEIPETMDELVELPGIARKTANVVLNMAFGAHTMAVDTHVFRVGNRTGLAPGKTPLEVELGLEKAIPAEFMLHAHHWLILHGRYTCLARKPRCEVCLINDLCRWPEKTV